MVSPEDPEWFVALCDAGYKGQNTDVNPVPSYEEHKSLVTKARTRWAQAKLRVISDGIWGRQSTNACAAFQMSRGLPPTGRLDMATLRALDVKPVSVPSAGP